MSEPAPETTAQPAQEPTDQTTTATSTEAPPWGDDFDPEKAWKLVQNLRADKEKLASRPALTDEQQRQLGEYNALVEASQTDAERREKAERAASERAAKAEDRANVLEVALEHGISSDDFDLLGSGSIEQIRARAQKIAAKNEAAKQASLEAAVQTPTAPAPRRPTEQLRPGASPAPDPLQDDSSYPAEWLSPSQRASVERARGTTS